MKHLLHFADAADFGDAGLRDIERAALEQAVEFIGAADVFAAGYRDAALGAHACEAGMVIRRPHRLLDPFQFEDTQFTADRHRLSDAPRAVAVHP